MRRVWLLSLALVAVLLQVGCSNALAPNPQVGLGVPQWMLTRLYPDSTEIIVDLAGAPGQRIRIEVNRGIVWPARLTVDRLGRGLVRWRFRQYPDSEAAVLHACPVEAARCEEVLWRQGY